MSNWEEDDDGYCTAHRTSRTPANSARARHSPAPSELRSRNQGTGFRVFPQPAARRSHTQSRCPVQPGDQFGVALSIRSQLGASHFATGHYARLIQGPGGVELHKARDASKDRATSCTSRGPSTCPDAHALGEIEKSAVRDRARRAGLPSSTSRTARASALLERSFREFLGQFLEQRPGPIESPGR